MNASVQSALRDGDRRQLGRLLREADVALVLAESGDGYAPAVLTSRDGARSLAVFTSEESFALWQRPEVVGNIPAIELPALALRQQVDQILFDPAGPTPVAMPPLLLRDVLDGVEEGQGATSLVGDQDFRAPERLEAGLAADVRAAVARTTEAYVVERWTTQGWVTVVAVLASDLVAAGVAHELQSADVGLIEVMVLDAATHQRIAESFPAARIWP